MKEIALNILDIVENSVSAGSRNIWITIRESERENEIVVSVGDDGPGIPADILQNVADPFITSRTTRKVGLGLPLLKYHAEAAGGYVEVESHTGKGTFVKAVFVKNHLDRQPLGDITGTLKVICRIDNVDFFFSYTTDKGDFNLSSAEVRTYLGVQSLNNQALLRGIGDMVRNNLEEISAEGADLSRNDG
ncbi:MAG TPA: sensor histidine kinase [Bacteroidales bacterium]|nr:sensor histidine kinase [Bacteroidales bacterium]